MAACVSRFSHVPKNTSEIKHEECTYLCCIHIYTKPNTQLFVFQKVVLSAARWPNQLRVFLIRLQLSMWISIFLFVLSTKYRLTYRNMSRSFTAFGFQITQCSGLVLVDLLVCVTVYGLIRADWVQINSESHTLTVRLKLCVQSQLCHVAHFCMSFLCVCDCRAWMNGQTPTGRFILFRHQSTCLYASLHTAGLHSLLSSYLAPTSASSGQQFVRPSFMVVFKGKFYNLFSTSSVSLRSVHCVQMNVRLPLEAPFIYTNCIHCGFPLSFPLSTLLQPAWKINNLQPTQGHLVMIP